MSEDKKNEKDDELEIKSLDDEVENDEFVDKLEEDVNSEDSDDENETVDEDKSEQEDDDINEEDKKDSEEINENIDEDSEDSPEENKEEVNNEQDDAKSSEAHEVEFTKDDPDLNEAVDKIVNEESNELMKAQDEERERQFAPPAKNKSLKDKVKTVILAWWNNRLMRNATFVILFLLFSLIALVPYTRYQTLNAFGVRVSSSMRIVDSQTGLPLKNIPVKLQNQEIRSDDDGNVAFSGLKLGKTTLTVDKLGYAEYNKDLTLGWGSNPIGDQPIVATGTQFTFMLKDWLSGQSVLNAEATSGEDSAKSDEQGKIVLTVGVIEDDSEVSIIAENYREEKIKLSDLSQEENEIKMVPAKKHVFVSNRDGKYDLYKIDVDGKNEEILLASTGKEREIPFVLPHQTDEFAAYISSRDGETNKDGFILDGLYLVNVNSGEVKRITRSEQLQVIGWVGNKLIYVAVVEGVSASNPQRSRIFTYDINTEEKKEIAQSNYFNDVKLVQDIIYYSVSSYAVPLSSAKLFAVDVNGENYQTIVDDQVWNILRTDYDKLVFNAIDLQWFSQIIGADSQKLDSQPANTENRIYTNSPDDSKSVWVDVRDGKGVILLYNIESKEEDTLLTKPGVENPV